jgi:outer membrane protein assembly factor BamB
MLQLLKFYPVIPAAVLLAALFPSEAADWPQFLGPTRNAISPETNLALAWPRQGPKTLWEKNIGHGFAGPVVAGGRLILFHRVGDKEVIDCLEAANGTLKWSADYPTRYRDDFGFDDGPRGTPAIADGKVFTFGAEGVLSCIDFSTGKKIWSADCKREFGARKGFFGMACSPLVEGNVVIVNVGGVQGTGIVAFDTSTGKSVWRAADDEASYSSPIAATINGRRLVLVFSRSGLFALDPSGGKMIFQFPWRSPISASVNAATPLVINDQLLLSASYDTGAVLLRLGGGTVEKIWSGDDVLSAHYATPVYRDGFLYGFHGRVDVPPGPSFRCVELKTGKVRWNDDGVGAGTVILAGDQLLIMTEKGELLRAAASRAEFKILDRAQILGVEVRAAPALSDGLFFARSKSKLVCVDLRKK